MLTGDSLKGSDEDNLTESAEDTLPGWFCTGYDVSTV